MLGQLLGPGVQLPCSRMASQGPVYQEDKTPSRGYASNVTVNVGVHVQEGELPRSGPRQLARSLSPPASVSDSGGGRACQCCKHPRAARMQLDSLRVRLCRSVDIGWCNVTPTLHWRCLLAPAISAAKAAGGAAATANAANRSRGDGKANGHASAGVPNTTWPGLGAPATEWGRAERPAFPCSTAIALVSFRVPLSLQSAESGQVRSGLLLGRSLGP